MSLELSNSQYKLEDLCLQITDGKHGDCENQENSGYYFVSVKDIDEGEIHYSNARQITKYDFEDTDKRTRLENEDILITNSGTIGKFVFVNSPLSRKTTFQKSVAIIKPNKNKILPKFLYYYLISEKRRLIEYAGGTTQKNLLLRDIRNFEVEVPDEFHQKKIIEILNTIDELIKTKKKLNKNLNHQRKLLFKNWFIDFNDFSDYELYDTAFGLIPKTWHIYDFKEILTKRTEKSNDDSIPMFSVTNTGIHPREDKFNKKLSASTSKFKLIYKNDLVFGMSREILNWGLMEEQIGGVSSAYNVFRINEEKINPFYLKSFIENYIPYFKDIIKPASREGQGIDQNVLLIKQIYVPPENIFNEFYNIDINFNKLINLNKIKIDKLTNLRDVLLPKLMSGEIDVSNINCE
ncbi:restriction endonuclease subunit S [uncultured Methanobrevibacter sp.]|uniref:restriction endonuclease subunit S n=1 Tax=uncultured Methanobrevibacter sp. TaxID=253161 RepID=UPI002624A0AB|nr:restriction endonuclease subunit S [uncultured Methanobrevibacter sp.]